MTSRHRATSGDHGVELAALKRGPAPSRAVYRSRLGAAHESATNGELRRTQPRRRVVADRVEPPEITNLPDTTVSAPVAQTLCEHRPHAVRHFVNHLALVLWVTITPCR